MGVSLSVVVKLNIRYAYQGSWRRSLPVPSLAEGVVPYEYI